MAINGYLFVILYFYTIYQALKSTGIKLPLLVRTPKEPVKTGMVSAVVLDPIVRLLSAVVLNVLPRIIQ